MNGLVTLRGASLEGRGTLGDRAARFMDEIARANARGEAAVMGVCNVTPDSFSDGGAFFDHELAKARVDALVRDGAAFVDVGGESTRPGAPRVSAAEQIARIAPVVAYAKDLCVVSVDTTSAAVAKAALELGAHAVNDVSLLSEPDLADVVASFGAALVLSHARGFQADMRGFGAWPEADYGDIVDDVLADYERARDTCVSRGVRPDVLVMDPGLGFSKSTRHSLALLRRTDELVARAGAPVLIGASRKSFLVGVAVSADGVDASTTRAPPGAEDRLGASIAAALHAQAKGAAVVRVHDVRETRQALALASHLGERPVGASVTRSSEPGGERGEARC